MSCAQLGVAEEGPDDLNGMHMLAELSMEILRSNGSRRNAPEAFDVERSVPAERELPGSGSHVTRTR
jgi:hypothetical protein